MVETIYRWGHDVLLAALAFLTYAIAISLK